MGTKTDQTHNCPSRNPDSQTVELDREFLDTVTVHGREYQKYSINNRIYFDPVDEVRERSGLVTISCHC